MSLEICYSSNEQHLINFGVLPLTILFILYAFLIVLAFVEIMKTFEPIVDVLCYATRFSAHSD
jgi:hypothetical protein